MRLVPTAALPLSPGAMPSPCLAAFTFRRSQFYAVAGMMRANRCRRPASHPEARRFADERCCPGRASDREVPVEIGIVAKAAIHAEVG